MPNQSYASKVTVPSIGLVELKVSEETIFNFDIEIPLLDRALTASENAELSLIKQAFMVGFNAGRTYSNGD